MFLSQTYAGNLHDKKILLGGYTILELNWKIMHYKFILYKVYWILLFFNIKKNLKNILK